MARYQEVADDLRRKILDGTYPPGKPLPQMRDLLQTYNLGSEPTLSRAYNILKSEQLIRRDAAKGMIVQDPNPVVVELNLRVVTTPIPSFSPWELACAAAGTTGEVLIKDVRVEQAPADVAALLGLREGDDVVARVLHATIGGRVVRLDTAYYPPWAKDTALAAPFTLPNGAYGALPKQRRPQSIARRLTTARPALDDEIKALKLPRGSWLLAAERLTADRQGRPVELLRVAANPARVRLVDEALPVQDVAAGPVTVEHVQELAEQLDHDGSLPVLALSKAGEVSVMTAVAAHVARAEIVYDVDALADAHELKAGGELSPEEAERLAVVLNAQIASR